MHEIVTACRNFLWTENPEKRSLALIGWDTICRGYEEGGLNFKEVLSWNKAMAIKLLWKLSHNQGGIWCQWVQAYHLKGEHVWHAKPSSGASWIWRSLLLIRDEVFQLLGGLTNALSLIENCTEQLTFSVHKLYSILRGSSNKVHWYRTVWDSMIMPRHAFVTWLAAHNRLLSEESLAHLTLSSRSGVCGLCKKEVESCNHLFFKCDFSHKVWRDILTWLGEASRLWGWRKVS